VQSTSEAELATKAYLEKDDDKVVSGHTNQTDIASNSTSLKDVINSTHSSMASSSSAPISNSNTPPGGPSGNYFESPLHSKFDSGELTNLNKKKRTDKGISFGKYSNSGGIQDIHNLEEYLDSKSSHMRRKRRETGKSIGITSQNLNTYLPRKDLTRTVEHIKLMELNATIDYSYCTKLQCTQGVGSKFHYIIPISKYMDLEYVTLQFRQVSLSRMHMLDYCCVRI